MGLPFSDPFDDQNARWDWSYTAGTGFVSAPVVENGLNCGRCRTTLLTVDSEYSDGSLHNPTLIQTGYINTFCRLKCSVLGHGSKGWGIWSGDGDNPASCWFMWMCDHAHVDYRGLRIYVYPNTGAEPVYNVLISGIDITQWHDYEVIRGPGRYTQFKIDGNVVGTYVGADVPTVDVRNEVWTDNRYLGSDFLLHWETIAINQDIYIDSVMVASQTPGGSHADDRFRSRFSRLENYTSTQLRRHNAQWHPSTGILNPAIDAQDDSDSRMF